MRAAFAVINTVIFYLIGLESYDEELVESLFPLLWEMIKK